MPRHSKNNTNSASFTYAERQMARSGGAGSQTGRLGRESLKSFSACSLCLEQAREPKMCSEGHIFCNECVLTSLLDQKKSIKKQANMLERVKKEEQDELAAQRAAARERVLREFEDSQKALSARPSPAAGSTTRTPSDSDQARGTKRKFELDEDELQKRTEAEEKAAFERNAVDHLEARRAKLPNFWLPSLTPTAAVDLLKSGAEVKLQTLCYASKPPHPLSLKSLVSVTFTREEGAGEGGTNKNSAPGASTPSMTTAVICPVCRKSLSNNTKSYALRPCGHVLCATCVDTLCRPDKACAKCNEPVAAPSSKSKNEDAGFVELKREGTGYAAGGQVEVKKFNVAFQG